MFRFIVGTSLKFRFILLALSVLLLYAGYDRLQRMPIDVFPEFAPPIVEIQTPALGMSPKEVEELVTVPLEDALAGLPELDAMRSKSVPQLSAIKLYFKRGTDLLWARQIVQERVDIVAPSLPTWSSPPFMLQPLSATSRVMKIGLSSKEHSVTDLSMMTYSEAPEDVGVPMAPSHRSDRYRVSSIRAPAADTAYRYHQASPTRHLSLAGRSHQICRY